MASGWTSRRSSRRTTTTCPVPPNVVDIYKLDEGQVGIPFAIYPSALFYQKGLFEEAGLKSRRTSTATSTRCPTAARSTGTTTRSATRQEADGRQGRQGREPGRLRPEEDQPVGHRAPARRPPRHGRLLRQRTLAAADGKTAQIPDAWAAAWKWYYEAIWNGPLQPDGPAVRVEGHQPERLPVLRRQHRDERELPLVDLWRRRPGDDWDIAAIPSLQRQGRRPRSTPTRSGS